MANIGKYAIGIRLLLLKQFIEAHAGVNRYVTRGEMEQYLAGKGYPVEKKTLYSDLAVLDSEFNIKLEYNPRKKGYRLTNPQFDIYELRMLVDCVQFASFITEEEVASLVSKIKQLSVESDRVSLDRPVVVKDRIARTKDSFIKRLDTIHQAIAEKRQLSFCYRYYSPDHGNSVKTSNHIFIVNPRQLVLVDILDSWILTLSGKSKTVKEKVAVARGFAKYLNTLGHSSFLPQLPKVKSDYIPYIYSDEELLQIMHYADNLMPKRPNECSDYLHLKVPMAIRILYGCGTRLGETMALQRKDVDFKAGTIFLRKTKFSKERLIPAHESLMEILEQYCLALGIMDKPDAYLFPGRKSEHHFTSRQMDTWFSEILRLANIDQRNKRKNERSACIHCFRHLFVLKSMQQLEAADHPVDLNDLLLPTYLGHECLIDTDKYMRFSGVQVPESLDAFEAFTDGLIPFVEVPYAEE